MLCVYSVNMCGVSRWVAVLIGLPFKCPLEYYGVVSGTGGFMRMTQQIHRCVDPSSKRLEKRGIKKAIREKCKISKIL